MTNALTAEQIRQIVRHAGGTEQVAVLADCDEPELVELWIAGAAVPSHEQASRLAFAHEWTGRIADSWLFAFWLSSPVVRSSKRPQRPITPAEGIRLGDFNAVRDSVRRLHRTIVE